MMTGLNHIAGELKGIENSLAFSKSRLDNFSDKKRLNKILKIFDPHAQLKHDLVNHFNAQEATNAWLKIYEIAHKVIFPAIDSTQSINVLFNAELPSSFICGMNHIAKTMVTAPYSWRATSITTTYKDTTTDNSGV